MLILCTSMLLPLQSPRAGEATPSPSPSPASEKLSELALFRRCYTHLTGSMPSRSSTLFQKVRDGEIGGIAACTGLLGDISLNAESSSSDYGKAEYKGSVLTAGSTEATETARAVLTRLNDFHRTWFPADDFTTAVANGTRYADTEQVFDVSEPALHLSRALFSSAASYSSIVNGSDTLEAIRSGGSQSLATFATMASGVALQTDATNLGVQTGSLLGIKLIAASDPKGAKSVTLDVLRSTADNTHALHPHLGGGLVGNNVNLLENLGLGFETTTDGGLVMGRRFARNLYKNLLCRDIPTVRESDATAFVTSDSSDPTIPGFRTSSLCMQCHASLDGFAGVVRNASYLPIELNGTFIGSMHLRIDAASASAEAGLVYGDTSFYKRPTNGRLYFRSYDGTLINKNVSTPSEMGTEIAATNDLYVCAAKRYFQYFTGISVNLQDEGSPTADELDAAETYYRDLVVSLGVRLKSHQSLKQLVSDIMELPLYQSRGMRDLVEAGTEESSP